MNILLIGSGGREHALLHAVSSSPLANDIYVAPGNGGMAELAQCVALDVGDVKAVSRFCKQNDIQFVIIGPEAPLVAGLSDGLRKAGILVFGPSKAAARLEGSKAFTKEICKKYGIPTADYQQFTDYDAAVAYVKERGAPIVIKADGLAAGKGVYVAQSVDEALAGLKDIFVDHAFGEAGSCVVIEEFLEGEELSFFALIDGKTSIAFGAAQDHKAAYDGDKGPNTGGMGTYSPPPVFTKELEETIMNEVVHTLTHAMQQEGCPYQGVLFAGFMLTKDGPKLLEINVRFGDPETQSLIARLDMDLLPLLLATAKADLQGLEVKLKDEAAVCVVMAAKGYPGKYEKGSIIGGLDKASQKQDVSVFHAGTARNDQGQILATGGRVLGVTATGVDIDTAVRKAYQAVDVIDWPEGFCRRDIAWRALQRKAS